MTPQNRKRISMLVALCSIFFLHAGAQDIYRYNIDLNKVSDDKLTVELQTPAISQKQITFYMPKIIPGTYSNADYGKFVSSFTATDKSGKPLPVKQASENSWQISNATKLSRISYQVEDTWESEKEHDIYDMSGTNIEDKKNFVINTPGFFGYFEGMKKVPFELTFTKPDSFYASTALIATTTNNTTDVFRLENADHLYDSPIMFSKPDTASIKLGKTNVLISSYSPRGMVKADQIADLLTEMLKATKNYLGGKLPVDKYAFIFYFNGEQPPLKRTGALEHNASSFYALPEHPFQNLAPILLDISAHEFFHIVTPLTISSREVKEFNFNEPVLSKHLWLYEGSTEYASDHVQVVEGLASPEQFLAKLSEKIKNSKTQYDDNLPFTELSKESAGKHKEQYGNVYEKGALICAALDVYLLKLSNGQYGIRNLKHDLGVKFGKVEYFDDDKLFETITKLTYPEVREFFKTYVEGPASIPYDKFFGYAGVNVKMGKTPTMGGIQLNASKDGNLQIVGTGSMNAQGKALGYKVGDEILAVNDELITLQNAQAFFENFTKTAKEGDDIAVKVRRMNEAGSPEEVVLKSKLIFNDTYSLMLNPSPTPEQLVVRNAWFGNAGEKVSQSKIVEADPKDVATIDAVVKSLYDVISGEAGPRNWDRFRSLFYADAYMAAMIPGPDGKPTFKKFSPEEYIKMNAPMFEKFSFMEKEIGRTEDVYGNIAQVFSAYEFTLGTPTPMNERGINSIELIKENDRWYVLSIIWNDESKENPIPMKYVNGPQSSKPKK
ncbi:MAG TPA: hypothetical protein VD927_04755 [Chryseosolibacter sp.]|nr:hypothetical protein [Chryseosolibacter sp.]